MPITLNTFSARQAYFGKQFYVINSEQWHTRYFMGRKYRTLTRLEHFVNPLNSEKDFTIRTVFTFLDYRNSPTTRFTAKTFSVRVQRVPF